MAVKLTRQDVFALLKADDKGGRIALIEKLAASYNRKLYARDELVIAEEIFRLLCKDAEVSLRATLSEALKLSDDLPHDIALTLAKDVEQVALPILQFSSVLNDMDLLDIIYDAGVQKLLAISRRSRISHKVAKNLIGRKLEVVTNSLFENADFTDNGEEFSKLIGESADSREIINSIVKSSSLPIIVIEKLMTEMSGQIYQQIKAKYNIVPHKFDNYLSHSREISTLSIIDHASTDLEIEDFAGHLGNFGRLTPSMILSSLCMGKRRFFICAIAKKAGMTRDETISIINKKGASGLHMLLFKAGIPKKLFELIDLIITLVNHKKAAEPDISTKNFCAWLVERLEQIAEKDSVEYIPYMLALAKQSQHTRLSTI